MVCTSDHSDKSFRFRLLEEYDLHILHALIATRKVYRNKGKCAPGGVWGGGLDCGSNPLNASPGGFFASFLAETRKEGPAGSDTIVTGDCHGYKCIRNDNMACPLTIVNFGVVLIKIVVSRGGSHKILRCAKFPAVFSPKYGRCNH